MAQTQTPLGLETKYDYFLQTPVGNDQKGNSVTVLSMLARLGLDPWSEASDLTALPKKSAWDRLDTLMARFADVPSAAAARADIVTRLVASLPRGNRSGLSDNKPVSKAFRSRLFLVIAAAFLLVHVIILMLGD